MTTKQKGTHTKCSCLVSQLVLCKLHAAAPELLEALRNMIDMVTDNRTHGIEIDRAVEVIAKAEGRE